mmetsp:Transcript_147918/g.411986  ORF Transcript_147918/g.411986 Transcript_147918/m.411986 type:complete len:218 (-) Transcript_147918:306-959(-)
MRQRACSPSGSSRGAVRTSMRSPPCSCSASTSFPRLHSAPGFRSQCLAADRRCSPWTTAGCRSRAQRCRSAAHRPRSRSTMAGTCSSSSPPPSSPGAASPGSARGRTCRSRQRRRHWGHRRSSRRPAPSARTGRPRQRPSATSPPRIWPPQSPLGPEGRSRVARRTCSRPTAAASRHRNPGRCSPNSVSSSCCYHPTCSEVQASAAGLAWVGRRGTA